MDTIYYLLTLLAQQGGNAAGNGGAGEIPWKHCIIMGVIMAGVFWFAFIRPQKKQREEREEMLDSLSENDEVLTKGGIFGTIQQIKEDRVTLKIDDNRNVKIDVLKDTILEIVEDE